jgi:hypothetical protein
MEMYQGRYGVTTERLPYKLPNNKAQFYHPAGMTVWIGPLRKGSQKLELKIYKSPNNRSYFYPVDHIHYIDAIDEDINEWKKMFPKPAPKAVKKRSLWDICIESKLFAITASIVLMPLTLFTIYAKYVNGDFGYGNEGKYKNVKDD